MTGPICILPGDGEVRLGHPSPPTDSVLARDHRLSGLKGRVRYISQYTGLRATFGGKLQLDCVVHSGLVRDDAASLKRGWKAQPTASPQAKPGSNSVAPY
eukprot:3941501-Pyramimonas_sp.AAC.1